MLTFRIHGVSSPLPNSTLNAHCLSTLTFAVSQITCVQEAQEGREQAILKIPCGQGNTRKVRVFATYLLKPTLPKRLEWKDKLSKCLLHCFSFFTRSKTHLLRTQIHVFSADRTAAVAGRCYIIFPCISLHI
jgi:hypothetical protein